MKIRFGALLFLGALVGATLSAAPKTSGKATFKSDPLPLDDVHRRR